MPYINFMLTVVTDKTNILVQNETSVTNFQVWLKVIYISLYTYLVWFNNLFFSTVTLLQKIKPVATVLNHLQSKIIISIKLLTISTQIHWNLMDMDLMEWNVKY